MDTGTIEAGRRSTQSTDRWAVIAVKVAIRTHGSGRDPSRLESEVRVVVPLGGGGGGEALGRNST